MARTRRKRKGQTPSVDLKDPQTRAALIEQLGIKQPKPKAGFLQRVGSLLGAFETGSAVFRTLETGDPIQGLEQFATDVFQGVTGAFTGDVPKDKKTFSNVLEELGVENKFARGAGGLALDILADPTTYLTFGTGGGTKIFTEGGEKVLTKAGQKVFRNATRRAEREIAEISAKTGLGIRSAAEKFASKNGIDLATAVGNKLPREIVEDFATKRITKFSDITGKTLAKDLPQEALELGFKAGEGLFAERAARFAGQKLFKIGGKGETVGRAIFDPATLAVENAAKVPFIKRSVQKSGTFLNSIKRGLGKLFDANFEAKAAMATHLGRDIKQVNQFVDTIVRNTGREADRVFKELAEMPDLHLLPYLIENTNPLDLPALQKYYKTIDNIEEHQLSKFFDLDVPKNFEEAGERFIRALDARDKEGMLKIISETPDSPFREVLQSQADNFDKFGGKYTRIGGSLTLNENTALGRKAAELRRIANEDNTILNDLGLGTVENFFARVVKAKGKKAGAIPTKTFVGDEHQALDHFVRSALGEKIDDQLGRVFDELDIAEAGERIISRDAITDELIFTGKPSTFPDWLPESLKKKGIVDQVRDAIVNKSAPRGGTLAREAYDLAVEQAKRGLDISDIAKEVDQLKQFDKSLSKAEDIPGLIDLVTNGQRLDRTGTLVPNRFSKYNPQTVLGKKRSWEMRLQGIEEGEVLYAIEEATGGKPWEKLTKKQQKIVRAEVTARIMERKAKVETARAYHKFLTHVRDKGRTDLGEKLVENVNELTEEGLKALKQQGWRTPKGVGNIMKGHIMPDGAATMLENTYKSFFTDEGTNQFLKLYDKVNGLWKTSVTAWFPAFHVRNGLSNMFTNVMAGIRNPRVYKQAFDLQKYANKLADPTLSKETLEKLGKQRIGKFTAQEALELAERHGVISAGGYWEEMSEGLLKSRPGKIRRFNPLSRDFVLTDVGTRVGNAVESNARIAHFLGRVDAGDTIEQAALSVKAHLFDYSELTAFEKNVMRRIIPFYTWNRKNAELMTRILVSNPAKLGIPLKGFRELQDSFSDVSEEDLEKMPAWARRGFTIFSKAGEKEIAGLTGFGTPIEGFGDFAGSLIQTIPGVDIGEKSVLSSFGPIPKGIIEDSTGISLFSGKRREEDTDARKYRNMPQIVKDAIGYQEVPHGEGEEAWIEYRMNPDTKFFLNTFLGRGIADISKVTTLGEGDEMEMNLLNLLTGIRRHKFNIDEETEKREREAMEALLDELIKQGAATEFTVQSLTDPTKELLQ
jgi:hypothetical protein